MKRRVAGALLLALLGVLIGCGTQPTATPPVPGAGKAAVEVTAANFQTEIAGHKGEAVLYFYTPS